MPAEHRVTLNCLVLNAGGTYLPNKDQAAAWAAASAADEANRPDLAFIQEIPSQAWLEAWTSHGYRAILGHHRGWTVRSAILTLLGPDQCPRLTPDHIPELLYHGEYVAAARLTGWAGGGLILLSVHASPNPTSEQYLAAYPNSERIRRRDGGADPRYRGQRFDADVALETIARSGPAVLACGDLNEARGWDQLPQHAGHTWGAEFFGTPGPNGALAGGSVQTLGLIDVALSEDGTEVITRRSPGHPSLQLDHIITTPALLNQIRNVAVDPDWTAQSPRAAGLADHAPIRFTLSQPGSAASEPLS